MKDVRLPIHALKQYETSRVLATYGRDFDLTSGPRFLTEDGVTLIFQRNQHQYEVKGKKTVLLQFEEILIASSNLIQTIKAKTKSSDLFIISFSKEALDEATNENKLTKKDIRDIDQGLFTKLAPTPWLKSLLRQFFYEVILMADSAPGCTFFLEKQVINETMRCLFANYHSKDQMIGSPGDADLREVIKLIEYHLHKEDLSILSIAKEAGMSESTLLRKFKASYGIGPYSYIKSRRLENAHSLIKTNKLSVSEACFVVGYSDFASFSKSFKLKFGVLPSHV